MHRLLTGLLDIAMTPNTDSRELNKLIDEMLTWNIHGHTEPVVFQPEMKKAIKKLVLAYTANKQRELLEWVEQEVVGADETGKPIALAPHVTRNYLRAAQREQLKNKKESL